MREEFSSTFRWKNLLTLLFLFLYISTIQAFEGPNLVRNANFEVLGSNGLPEHWGFEQISPHKIEMDEENYKTPPRSVKCIRALNEPEKYLAIRQNIEVQEGCTYKYSVYVKCSKVKPTIVVWMYDEGNKFLGASEKVQADFSDDFEQYTVEFKVPSTGVKAQIRVETYFESEQGEFWIDSASVRRFDSLAPNSPKSLEAVLGTDGKVMLHWLTPEPADDGDLPVTYNVYRYPARGFVPRTEAMIATGVMGNTFLDSSTDYLYPDESMCYVVTGIDWVGNESKDSFVVVSAEDDQAVYSNIIENGDFETVKPSGAPYRFWYGTFPEGNSIGLDQTEYASPNKSLKFVKTTNCSAMSAIYEGPVSGHFSVKVIPEATYRVSIRAKSQMTGGNVRVLAYVHGKDGKYLKNTPALVIPAKTDWGYFELEYIAESDWDHVKFLIETTGGSTSEGVVWLDDFGFYLIDQTPPNPVTIFSGSRQEDGIVHLTWLPPDLADDGEVASYYQVWRSENADMADATLLTNYITKTDYEDFTAAYNIDQTTLVDYYYKVIAFDRVNNASIENPIIKLEKGNDQVPPEIPRNFRVVRMANGAGNLEWLAPLPASDLDEVIAYAIYRSEEPDCNPTKDNRISVVEGTSFIDEDILFTITTKTYYYRVTAFDKVYNESEPTEVEMALGACRVEGEVVFKSSQMPVEGAKIFVDNTGIELETDFEGKFDFLIAEGIYNIRCEYPLYHKAIYEDKELMAGETVVLTFEIERDLEPPEPPLDFRASNENPGMIVLTWKVPLPAKDGDLPVSYILYRSTIPDFDAIEETILRDDLTALSWNDVTVTSGEKYYYKIKSVDHAGNPSEAISLDYPITPKAAIIPKLLYPSKGEPVILGSLKLEWEELLDVSLYTVEVSKDKTFPEEETFRFFTTETVIPLSSNDGIDSEGRWHWRVKVDYENGVKSEFTSAEEFVTVRKPNKLSISYLSFYPQIFYKNDAEEMVVISFVLGANASTTIEVYNTSGKKVLVLENDVLRPFGENKLYLERRKFDSLSTGLYFINLIAKGEENEVRAITRMLFFK